MPLITTRAGGSASAFGGLRASVVAAPSSYESIATTTVTSATTSSVTFSSIPATYKHLQVRTLVKGSGTNYVLIRFNSDTGSNYTSHFMYGDGTGVGAATASTAQTSLYGLRASSGSQVGYGGSILDILDYTNTNKYKTTNTICGDEQNGSGFIFILSGLWLNTNAITSITLLSQSGDFDQYSSFALYGIKGA
jgi:hypothetical protein